MHIRRERSESPAKGARPDLQFTRHLTFTLAFIFILLSCPRSREPVATTSSSSSSTARHTTIPFLFLLFFFQRKTDTSHPTPFRHSPDPTHALPGPQVSPSIADDGSYFSTLDDGWIAAAASTTLFSIPQSPPPPPSCCALILAHLVNALSCCTQHCFV